MTSPSSPGARSLLLLAQDFPPALGGIQTLTYEVYTRLADLARFAFAPALSPGESECDLRGLPLQRSRRPSGGSATLAYLIEATRRLGRLELANSLLHCNHVVTAYAAWVLRYRYGLRYVVWAHGAELASRRHRVATRTALARASAIFVNSDATARQVARLLAGRPVPPLFQVPLGAPPAWTALPVSVSPVPRAAPVILTISRLARFDRLKGVDTAIRALAVLRRRGYAFQYRIVGDGDDRARLERLAHAEGIASRTRFLGRVDAARLMECYDDADLFLLCSREESRPGGAAFEGFGIVFLEAAARSRAVIAGRSGGIPDAVIHGETGLLVDPDSPAAIADGIARLINDRGLRQRLGQQGRARVAAEFNWDNTAAQVRAIHNHVCFGTPLRAARIAYP